MDGISIDVACILFIPNNPDYLQSQCGRKIKSAKSSVIKVYEVKVEKNHRRKSMTLYGEMTRQNQNKHLHLNTSRLMNLMNPKNKYREFGKSECSVLGKIQW